MLQRLYWSWLQKNEAAFTAGEGQRVFQTLHRADPCLGNGKPGPTRESAERGRGRKGKGSKATLFFYAEATKNHECFCQ